MVKYTTDSFSCKYLTFLIISLLVSNLLGCSVIKGPSSFQEKLLLEGVYRTEALKQIIIGDKVVNDVYFPTKYFAGYLIEHENSIQFLYVPNGQHDKLEIGVSKDFVVLQMKKNGDTNAFIVEFEPCIEKDLFVGKFIIKEKYTFVGKERVIPALKFKPPRSLLRSLKEENKITAMNMHGYIKDINDWKRDGDKVKEIKMIDYLEWEKNIKKKVDPLIYQQFKHNGMDYWAWGLNMPITKSKKRIDKCRLAI